MTQPNMLLLYVGNAQHSAKFYARLLHLTPHEDFPDFVMFQLANGTQLALRTRQGIQPPPMALPGAMEIGLQVDSRKAVDDTFATWRECGLNILMLPTEVPFGYTFVAEDPDGHRLRVYALGAGS